MAAPLVISASRRTDIPAFQSEWFMDCMRVGRAEWVNPFNGKAVTTDLSKTKFVVFWTKNPLPVMCHLEELRRMGVDFYFQYTLNDYGNWGLERNVPPLVERIRTFKSLADKIGPERVIWRFDPIVITDKICWMELCNRFRRIAEELKGYTEKIVFSFCDYHYRKVVYNMHRDNFLFKDLDETEMFNICRDISECAKSLDMNVDIATCAEKIDLSALGITHNSCVDKSLILRLTNGDKDLEHYFSKVRTGQRQLCNCASSVDIGTYNTCQHGCAYCYATYSRK